MRREILDWAEEHGETEEEYLVANSGNNRREQLSKLSVSELLEYFPNADNTVKDFVIDLIIEKNLDS